MKALKTVIGVLASLFAVAHVFALIGALVGQNGGTETFAVPALMGHVIGAAIGLLVAVLCFRKKKTVTVNEIETTQTRSSLKKAG
jgi:microcystin-dependent protein